jgi:hypothetical protein
MARRSMLGTNLSRTDFLDHSVAPKLGAQRPGISGERRSTNIRDSLCTSPLHAVVRRVPDEPKAVCTYFSR